MWLCNNCPDISRRTAYRLMFAARYARETGHVASRTVPQLYLEAGIIKGDDGLRQPDRMGLPSVLMPLRRASKTFTRFYTDQRLDAVEPLAAPSLLACARDAMRDLVSLEGRLMSRFGDLNVEAR